MNQNWCLELFKMNSETFRRTLIKQSNLSAPRYKVSMMYNYTDV